MTTFMILRISSDGDVYLVEYDNPACILIRHGQPVELSYKDKQIAGKPVRESRFKAQPGDYFVIVSDGVTQAGMGETLSFGWGWDAVAHFAAEESAGGMSAPRLIAKVLDMG